MGLDWERLEKESFLWKKIGDAIKRFSMIEAGDKIGIGISGGKDSLLLVLALRRFQRVAPVDFTLHPYIINQGIEDFSIRVEPLKKFITGDLGLELKIVNADILKIVFEDKKVKNGCFLCSRLRRGVLYRELKQDGVNVLALGHHMDDHVETFLLNIFFSGSTRPMPPAYFSGKHKIKVIRPLCLLKEREVQMYVEKYALPVTDLNCHLSENKEVLQRKKIKWLLKELEADHPEVKNSIFWASQKFKKEKR